MTYEQALEYLTRLGTFGINLGLTRIEKLLDLMQHPERSFKTVHVTGTNGKGSTTAMVSAILVASGIKTGMYTSPHLVEYTERMMVDGEQISQQAFADAITYTSEHVDRMVNDGWEHPTEFEVLTAAAFYYFAAMEVEYAVIEVGLGGLLDSTNVILPEVAVITNVTLEHTDRCGDTVAEIAQQKAGIIKTKIPLVTAAKGEALAVINQYAQLKSAATYVLGQDFCGQHQGFVAYTQKLAVISKQFGDLGTFSLSLLGKHQIENGALAVMAAMLLAQGDNRICLHSIRQGLMRVNWPGRFEVIAGAPVIIIDGAHNPDGARMLRATLDELFPHKEITFLLGILQDKDISGIVTQLIRPQDCAVVVAPISNRAGRPEEVASQIVARHVEIAPSISQGLERVKELSGASGIICVAGSLYLIGAARQSAWLLSRQSKYC